MDHNGQLTEDELITAQNLSDRTPEEEKEMNSEIERFRAADEDNDLELTREEFFAFLYPRNYEVTYNLFIEWRQVLPKVIFSEPSIYMYAK